MINHSSWSDTCGSRHCIRLPRKTISVKKLDLSPFPAPVSCPIGHESAAKAVYGNGPHTTPKSLSQFLRGAGMGLENIAAMCQLRFGVGSASSVRRWTDPTVDQRWNAYRRSLSTKESYAPVKKYARNLFTRGFTKAEIVRRCRKRFGQGCKSSVACWVSS